MDVEVDVVGLADAVVDPGAVVIVTLHAPVADIAMAALGQADDSTEGAQALSIERFHEGDEADIGVALNIRALTTPDGHERDHIVDPEECSDG